MIKSKIELFKTKHPNISSNKIDKILECLPNKNTQYLRFIIQKGIDLDYHILKKYFTCYDLYKKRAKWNRIEKYKSFVEFTDDMDNIMNSIGEIIYSSYTMKVTKHYSFESIEKMSRSIHHSVKDKILNYKGEVTGKAKWCIAASEDFFEQYACSTPESILDNLKIPIHIKESDIYTVEVKSENSHRMYVLISNWLISECFEIRDEYNLLVDDKFLYLYPEILKTPLVSFFDDGLYYSALRQLDNHLNEKINQKNIDTMLMCARHHKGLIYKILSICEKNKITICEMVANMLVLNYYIDISMYNILIK